MTETNLHALFAETPLPATAGSGGFALPGAAEQLRLSLAVRGWTKPLDLIASGTEGLTAVAPEVETAAGLHPGKWFLTVASRVAALAASDDNSLRAACSPRSPDDPADPVLRAFAEALSPAPLVLAKLDDATLKALVNVSTWLGSRWHQPLGTEHLNAEIAARTLTADLERMTAQPLVGAVHQASLKRLIDFAGRPTEPWLTYTYIHAAGGGGKTTLLANLQRELAELLPPPAVARIDFDEPAIDPGRLLTLNLALFEQLTASAPAVAMRMASVLPDLRRSASALRASTYDQSSLFSGPSGGALSPQDSLAAQKSVSESVSDQSSILYRLLAPESLGGPLVLILDTAELVMTDNDRAAAGILAWLEFLHREAGAEDVRLIVAGRDPPPPAETSGPGIGTRDLLTRLNELGSPAMPPNYLPELTESEADTLLKNCGVKDKALRSAAAAAVPGNPLLLRLTADALMTDDAAFAASVHSAHAMTQVDHISAQNYLTRRIIAHVSDPKARPLVIPAMASPILTRPLMAEIIRAADPVLPDGQSRASSMALAKRVFKSLGSAVWLGRLSLDGKTFTFNRDLRMLVQTLVDAVPGEKEQRQILQVRLFDYHSQRSTSIDRALTVYQAAMLGHGYKLPRGPRVLELLRNVFDQLPEGLKGKLAGTDRASESAQGGEKHTGIRFAETNLASNDRDWTLYLEGSGKRAGQGERLIQDDQADEALKLYRDRPTRVAGLPPTFVIQAFADLGTWNSREIDLPALVRELGEKLAQNKSGLSSEGLSRLYWITRFGMIANAGNLSLPHLDLIARACEGLRGPGLTTLPALVAIAEAQSGRQLLNDRLISGIRGHEAEARVALVRRMARPGAVSVSQIAVTQRDWSQRATGLPWIESRDLGWVQKEIDALHGKPIAAVNQTFANLHTSLGYKWDGRDMTVGVLLLRGQTVEILRPLRETLTAIFQIRPDSVIDDIVAPTIRAMTIRPKELEESVFVERLHASPRAWLTGLVGFADRARLLRGLCERIVEASLEPGQATDNARRVAKAFIAWDRALCGGGSSEWGK